MKSSLVLSDSFPPPEARESVALPAFSLCKEKHQGLDLKLIQQVSGIHSIICMKCIRIMFSFLIIHSFKSPVCVLRPYPQKGPGQSAFQPHLGPVMPNVMPNHHVSKFTFIIFSACRSVHVFDQRLQRLPSKESQDSRRQYLPSQLRQFVHLSLWIK